MKRKDKQILKNPYQVNIHVRNKPYLLQGYSTNIQYLIAFKNDIGWFRFYKLALD